MILEEQWADFVCKSQEGITEKVMFQEHLGEHVVQQVEKNGKGVSFTSTTLWVCPNLPSPHPKSFLCLLLASLVSQMLSRKPYREKEFGTSSLRLLHTLHPITSRHPVIYSNVGQLWMKAIPQMLQILDGERLVGRGRNGAGAVGRFQEEWSPKVQDGLGEPGPASLLL